MRKKILILGSAGMLGHMVYHYFIEQKKYDIIDSSYPVTSNKNSFLLDVTNKKELESFVLSQKPDVVINCIGILIKGSQENPANAIYLNSYLPHQLSGILQQYGGKLVHISTDCAFSGKKGNYIESDFKDAPDVYGLSKALGEVENGQDLTLRTSIIGPELKENGEGLFHWFLNQTGEVNGYSKMIWGGVTTLELARAIDAAIEQKLTGLIHITNGQPISKYELLTFIQSIWKKNDVVIIPANGKIVDKSLKTERNDFDYKPGSYVEMLNELNDFMILHSELYKRYIKL